MKTNKVVVFALMTMISVISFAQTPGAAMGADSVLAIIQSSMAPAVNTLTSQAITWLAILASLQLFMTNYGVLKSGGDIEAALAKTAGAVAWIGVCIYIINNGPQFISDVGTQMFGLLGLTLPSPGSIIASTLTVVASLAAVAVGVGGVGILGSTTAGMLIVYILLFILAIGMFFAFKIFMVQLELGLIVMLAPLSFAFLGLNALKDQGIAPFKALISLAYRIILMTLILSAFTKVSNVATTALTGFTGEAWDKGIGDAVNTVLSALGAYLMLAYVFYKSDSIAATLAGGSTSMGTGDLAGAAAAGAAAGAAVATGGASMAAGATKVPQSMANFMSKLAGGGSVSNASSRGTGGGGATDLLKPDAPVKSMAGSGGNAAPSFPTTSGGAPRKAETGSPASSSAPGATSGGGDDSAGQAAMAGSGAVALAPGVIPPLPGQSVSDVFYEGLADDIAQDRATANAGEGVSPGAAEGAISKPATGGGGKATPSFPTTSGGAPRKAESGAAGSPGAGSTGSAVPTKTASNGAAAPTFATNKSGAPVRPSADSQVGGGIAGSGSQMDETARRLNDFMTQQNAPKKPTTREAVGNANNHIAQEKAATHVSINLNSTD